MDVNRYISLYSTANRAYQQRNYDMAEELCNIMDKEFGMSLRSMLLRAYVERDTGRCLSEYKTLQELLERFTKPQGEEYGLLAMAWSLMGSVCSTLALIPESVRAFLHSAELEKSPVRALEETSNAIFAANYGDASGVEWDDTEWQSLYEIYQKQADRQVKEYPLHESIAAAYSHKKLRIGYLSADFCVHPVMSFAYPLLTGFDRDSFEVYCYNAGCGGDWLTEELQSLSVIWRDIYELNDAQAAALIRQDEIDVLVDLGGHTSNNRLGILVYRPAWVQLSGIGYMGSTGLRETDYFLADTHTADSMIDPAFREKLLRLPHSHLCYHPLQKFPKIEGLPAKNNNFITLGCFNNFAKVTNRQLKLWSEIMKKLPASKLILKHKLFTSDEGKAWAIGRLLAAGLPVDCVEFLPFDSNYLADYHKVDIALDTFPYEGGQTTCEALYMGVPVVSRRGRRHGSRFGHSLLTNLGLGGLSAPDEASYVENTVALASDLELLEKLHFTLRNFFEESPLRDELRYTRQVETLYERTIRERHIDGIGALAVD